MSMYLLRSSLIKYHFDYNDTSNSETLYHDFLYLITPVGLIVDTQKFNQKKARSSKVSNNSEKNDVL